VDHRPREIAGGSIDSLAMAVADNAASGWRRAQSDNGFYYLGPNDGLYSSNLHPNHLRLYAPYTGPDPNLSPFVGMNTGGTRQAEKMTTDLDRTYSAKSGIPGVITSTYGVPVHRGVQTVSKINRDGNGTQDKFIFPYTEITFTSYTPSNFRYINNASAEWRIQFTSDTGAFLTYDQEVVRGATAWMAYDATQADVQAELTAVFGTHVDAFGQTNPTVFFEEFYTGDGTDSRINNDFMLWQDGMRIKTYYGGGTPEAEAQADAAGLDGHWGNENTGLSLGSELWTNLLKSDNVYLTIHVRDSNYPGDPESLAISTKGMHATRWSDGQLDWERNFGSQVDTSSEIGPDKLIIAFNGNTVVGHTLTKFVDPTL